VEIQDLDPTNAAITQQEFLSQICLRLDRYYEAAFAAAISISQDAEKASEAAALVTDYADALEAAGFPDLAEKVLEVIQ